MKNYSKIILASLLSLSSTQLFADTNTMDYSEGKNSSMGQQMHRPRPSSDEVATHLFSMCDSDGSQDLDTGELLNVTDDMIQHRPQRRDQEEDIDVETASEELASKILAEFDSDGSNTISLDELKEALNNMQPNHPPRR